MASEKTDQMLARLDRLVRINALRPRENPVFERAIARLDQLAGRRPKPKEPAPDNVTTWSNAGLTFHVTTTVPVVDGTFTLVAHVSVRDADDNEIDSRTFSGHGGMEEVATLAVVWADAFAANYSEGTVR